MGAQSLTLTREQLLELQKMFLKEQEIEENPYVRVSEDKMEAWLYLSEPSIEKMYYEMDELLEMLKEEGVVAGIRMPLLTAMIKKGVYEREILVAKGKNAIEGKDGFFEYFFPLERMQKTPVIRPDGSVDYSSMNMLQNVKSGDKLAEYHPAVPGEDGFTVDGRAIKVPMVKEMHPLRGMSISKQDNIYYAKTTGKVEAKDGSIDIRTVHEVNGDVDSTTGKIEFFGDITISGNVGTGTVVRAGRNLIIEGTVESAVLFAGGDIILKRGVQGNKKGQISTRGSVYADFIEHCEVNADVDVKANYILNSIVRAGGKVFATGKKGSIIGGRVSGLQGIEAGNLGNPVEVKTFIHAGYEKTELDKMNELKEEDKQIQKELQDILADMQYMIKGKRFHDPEAGKGLLELNERKDECFKKLDSIKEETEKLLVRMNKGKNAKVYVVGTTYLGVVLEIEALSRSVSEEMQYMFYANKNGFIIADHIRRIR